MEEIEEIKSGGGKNKSRNTALWTALVTVTAAIAVLLAVLRPWDRLKNDRPDYTHEQEITVSDETIIGNYDVRFDFADSVTRFVGVVSKDLGGSYVLTILSEMAPKVLMLNVDADGYVSCDDLGRGQVSYKAAMDKTTIRFTGENYICTLTK